MTTEVLTSIFSFATPLLFGVGGWFASKKATAIKNKKGIIENKRDEVSLYKDIADDLEKRLLSRDSAIENLRKKLEDISTQNLELLQKTAKLEKDYSALLKNYKELEKTYSSLLIQIEKK